MAHRKLQSGVLPLALLTTAFLVVIGYAQGSDPRPASSSELAQIGKMLTVRRILENRYFVSRYPQIHYYMLYFAIRVSDRTYCSEYETPVLDEIR